ncbi:tape measure protein [Marinicauda sp. Alg238-R41]|uniref:tape measure protein n=1 Tax=Marinicauda sp. Alg238-R41 TaxID=2993447 RepID=UPI0022E52C65|nr:tape measure protein [Marinicauda sp. Alg238-R41]
MAAFTADKVVVELQAKIDDHVRNFDRAETKFDRNMRRIEGSARRTENNSRKAMQGVAGGLRFATAAAVTFFAAMGGRELIQTLDQITLVESRIRLYSDSAEEAAETTERLRGAATEMGVGFESMAEIFARLAPAQEKLNLNARQMESIARSVGAAAIISGATQQEAASSTIQLSQAFASGELRGEELRSVMEAMPRVMRVLEDRLGKTTGELREMAEKGELTADIVANALLASAQELNGELADLDDTVGRASQAFGNEFVAALKAVDDQLGVTTGLAAILRDVAEGLRARRVGLDLGSTEEELRTQLSLVGELAGQVERLAQDRSRVRSQYAGGRVDRARLILGNDVVEQIEDQLNEEGIGWETIFGNFAGDEEAMQQRLLRLLGPLREAAEQIREELRRVEESADDAGASFTPETSPENQDRRERIRLQNELAEAQARADHDHVQALEDQLDTLARAATYEKAGYERAQARALAERDQASFAEARSELIAREVRELSRAAELEAAQTGENFAQARQLELQEELRERILAYQNAGLATEEALAQAMADIALLERARVQAQQRALENASLEHRIRVASLSGARDLTRELEAQQAIRERARRYQDEGGLDADSARDRATREVNAEETARRYGEMRDVFARSFSDGIRAALSGDLKNFLSNSFGTIADEAFRRLGEQLFDAFFDAPADIAKASAEGAAKGTAAAAPMGAAITTSGATAAAAMGQAITAAGLAAAQAMAAAVASGGGGGKVGTVAKFAAAIAGGGKPLPGKARGGPVTAGTAYMVGEKGPEPFIPKTSGTIIPNGALKALSDNRPARMGPITIKLEAVEGQMFDLRVRDIAGPMAAQASVTAIKQNRADLASLRKRQTRSLGR